MFVQLAMEVPSAHPQFPGRQRPVSFRFFQGPDNKLLLRFLQGQIPPCQDALWIAGRYNASVADRGRQILRCQFVAAAHDHCVLDRGAQFAYIAGPLVAHQQFQRVGREALHLLRSFGGLHARVEQAVPVERRWERHLGQGRRGRARRRRPHQVPEREPEGAERPRQHLLDVLEDRVGGCGVLVQLPEDVRRLS